MIEKLLAKLGLSEKEIKIYLAALPLGSSASSILAKRTSMSRSTARFNCDQLVKIGLMKKSKKGNTQIYFVEPPERILSLIEEEKEALERKKAEAEVVMTDLRQLFNPAASLPKVDYFMSEEGLNKMFKEILKLQSGNEICSFANSIDPQFASKETIEAFDLFTAKRLEKNVKSRLLINQSDHALEMKKKDKKSLRETRISNFRQENEDGGEIYFLDHAVYGIATDGRNIFGYSIENKMIAKMQKHLFEMAWEFAEKL